MGEKESILIVDDNGSTCKTRIHIGEQEYDEVTIVFIATERENIE